MSATLQKMDGAQALIKTLDDLGIEYIFGYSGGAAMPIFDALETVKTNIKFILMRHEQGAAHMADGYARATGKPAVVLVTSGPGRDEHGDRHHDRAHGLGADDRDHAASRSRRCSARTPSRRRTSSASPCRW